MARNLHANAATDDTEIGKVPPEAAGLPGGSVDISRRRLSATVVFEWISRAAGVALGIAVIAVLTRYLGPERFGDLSLAFALTGIAGAAADVGFKQSAVRQAAIDPPARGEIASTYVVVRGVFALLLFAIVTPVGFAIADGRESALVVVIVAGVLPLGFFSSSAFLLHVRLRNELYAITILVQSVLWLAVVVIARSAGWSLLGIGIGYFVTVAIQSAVTYGLAQRLVPFSFAFDRDRAGQLLHSALPLTLAGLFMALTLRIDGVLIYQINGPADAGLYTSAYRVLEQLAIVPSALIALIAPLLAHWITVDPGRYRRAIATFSRYLVLVAVPVTFSIFVLAQPLVVTLFGPDFADAGDYLTVLSLAFLGTAVSALYFGALVAAGEMRTIAVIQGFLLLGIVASNLVFLPRFGPMAAAVITVVAELALATAFYSHLLRRDLAPPPSKAAIRLLLPAIAMVGAGLAVLPLGEVFAAVAGVASFAVAAFATRLITAAELRGLASRDVVATI